MELIIDNHLISHSLIDILQRIRSENQYGYLKDIEDRGREVKVSCPSHKNGQERHASCNILAVTDEETPFGTCHCFTCGYSASLPQFVSDCFRCTYEDAEEWLIVNFGDTLVEEQTNLPEISLSTTYQEGMSTDILDKYSYYHPYMWKRKLSKEVVEMFDVGYDKDMNAITFPVFDEHNVLRMITRRAVDQKRFYIPKGVEKPVYLLNEIIRRQITTVVVCESQINALYSWTLGYPAVAMIGVAAPKQYAKLRKSGIRRFILAFDGDEAGRKATKRFKENMNDDVLIDVLNIPEGKDLNDLSEEEVRRLFKNI